MLPQKYSCYLVGVRRVSAEWGVPMYPFLQERIGLQEIAVSDARLIRKSHGAIQKSLELLALVREDRFSVVAI